MSLSNSFFSELNEVEVREFREWADKNFDPNKEPDELWHPVVRHRWAELKAEYLLGIEMERLKRFTPVTLSINWDELRAQKEIIYAISYGINGRPYIPDLQGIVHLIDEIQDQAAEILGDEIIFGREANDGA